MLENRPSASTPVNWVWCGAVGVKLRWVLTIRRGMKFELRRTEMPLLQRFTANRCSITTPTPENCDMAVHPVWSR